MDFTETYLDTCSTVSQAVRQNNVKVLKQLIRAGRPVDVKDNRGWQAIHEASYHGHIECLKIIIAQGVEIDCRTFEDNTPLMLACKGGYPLCVETLLYADADPNSKTREDFTPLWEAVVVNLECVEILINSGADVNHPIFTGDTALHEVVRQHKDSYMDTVKYLLQNGADLSAGNESKLTPFFLAAENGLIECLRYFIEYAQGLGEEYKQSIVNKTADDNATPLYLSTQENHIECVELLLEHGADPNIYITLTSMSYGYDEYRVTPLQVALEKGNVECVKMLASVTDLYLLDDKQSPYHPIRCAVQLHNEDCIKILLQQEFYKLYFLENPNASPFIYDIEIKPAILFLKLYPECLRRWLTKDAEEIQDLYDDSIMLLLFLRFAKKHNCLDVVPKPRCQSLLNLIASAKYTHPGFSKTETDNTDSEPHTSRDDPHVVYEQFMNSYLYLVASRGNGRLQDLCRWNIVQQLILTDNYTSNVIETKLNIPTLLQQFLMYKEHDWSDKLMEAAQQIIKEDECLDIVIEEVSVD